MNQLPEAPPPKRQREPRLSDEAKSLQPDGYIDTTDPREAACIVSYGRYRGWSMVRRTVAGNIRVWRIA